ncbi:MAG: cytochrome C, partial [Alphaproteobacteria bacterium]|nr:cytochrome C [Alphaproteobacteria bacterium]
MQRRYVGCCASFNARRRDFFVRIVALALLGASTWPPSEAQALPAFAVQTGQPCKTCHIGAFGPQLTPFGRNFKLNGYTMRAGESFTLPVSAMAVASYVHTQKDQPQPPAEHYGTNDNTTLDEASIFLAGGIGNHLGGFAQVTYSGVDRAWAWDNVDLRAVGHTTLLGSDVLLGLSLNNNPTIQDVWATLPGWGFPFTDSDLMPGPGAATVISDALAQNVFGESVYAWWDDHLYTEI